MELRNLQTFQAVAKHLHFTRAAEDLHLAQSTVSAQIKALEEELGVKLFDRIGRRVLLTAAGERLLEYARRMAEMGEEIKAQVGGTDQAAGTLTVRVPETLACEYMPEVATRFLAQYPSALLNLINCDDRSLRDELAVGSIDLAFLLIDHVLSAEVEAVLLREETLALAAIPDHPLAAKACVEPRDLADHTLLLMRTDCSYRKAFERLLAEHGVSPRIHNFWSLGAMRRCLARGLGVSILPMTGLASDLAQGRLARLPWALGELRTGLFMIRHAGKWRSPLLAAFMGLCREVMAAG